MGAANHAQQPVALCTDIREAELYEASFFRESQDAGGGGTGVFALPSAAVPAQVQQHTASIAPTVPSAELRESAVAAASDVSDSCKPVAPQSGNLGTGGWATGSGKAVQVSAAAISRAAGVLSSDAVQGVIPVAPVGPRAKLAAEASAACSLPDAAVPPRASTGRGRGGWATGGGKTVQLSTAAAGCFTALFREVDEVAELAAKAAQQPSEPGPRPVQDTSMHSNAAGTGGAGCWATGSGKPVPTSAGEAARGAALLQGNMAHGFRSAAASAAAGPEAHQEKAEQVHSGHDGPTVAHPATGAQTAASGTQQPPPPALATAAKQGGSPWATGSGSAVSVSNAAAKQAAAIMGNFGADNSAALHGEAEHAAAHGDSWQSERECSTKCGTAASKAPVQVFVPPVLARVAPPHRKTGGGLLSLHRSALERSARGALAASALPAPKAGRAFRSPLRALATAQQVPP